MQAHLITIVPSLGLFAVPANVPGMAFVLIDNIVKQVDIVVWLQLDCVTQSLQSIFEPPTILLFRITAMVKLCQNLSHFSCLIVSAMSSSIEAGLAAANT